MGLEMSQDQDSSLENSKSGNDRSNGSVNMGNRSVTLTQTTRWAIISEPPKFFVYNFHCKLQNFMKFQQKAY